MFFETLYWIWFWQGLGLQWFLTWKSGNPVSINTELWKHLWLLKFLKEVEFLKWIV